MKAHKRAIIYSIIVFVISSTIALYIQQQPENRELSFLQNIALGVWSSNLLVLILEIINYNHEKDNLIFQYVNEAQKLYNSLIQVRKQSGKASKNLGDIIMALEPSLDFTHLFLLYYSISFFITYPKLNKCKPKIDDVQKGLFQMHRSVISFSEMYQIASNEKEQKIVIKNYCSQDEKTLDMVLKRLEALKVCVDKHYQPIIAE